MDEADITTYVGNYGLCVLNYYHNNNSQPFLEDINLEYVEEDNIKYLLTDYSNWLDTTTITKCFYENIQSIINIKLNITTLNNYLSNIIIILK